MVDSILNSYADIISTNVWLAPIFALIAGVIISFSPCAIASVPLIISYVGATKERNTKKAFLYSVLFAVGNAVAFVTLGLIATATGKIINNSSSIWYIILGSLMILMALQTFGVINIIPSTNLMTKNKKRGFLGAFLTGILGGIFASPCSTPVLVVLLAIVAGGADVFYGILLMVLYSIGHSTLIIITGTSLGFVQKLSKNPKYKIWSNILKGIMGGAILLVGFYMFYSAF